MTGQIAWLVVVVDRTERKAVTAPRLVGCFFFHLAGHFFAFSVGPGYMATVSKNIVYAQLAQLLLLLLLRASDAAVV